MNDVNSAINEFHNVLTDYEFKYSDNFDTLKNGYVNIEAPVLPKEYTPNVTKASIIDDQGNVYPLTFKDGKYFSNIQIKFNDKITFSHITLDDNGTLRNQKLTDTLIPKSDILSTINIIDNNDSLIINKNGLTLKVRINTSFDMLRSDDHTKDISFKSAHLVVEKNGKEIDRKKNNEFIIEDDYQIQSQDFIKDLDYNVKENDCLLIYLEINEGDFTCRYLMNNIKIGEKGMLSTDEKYNEYLSNNGMVVAKYKDKIIYNANEKLFK